MNLKNNQIKKHKGVRKKKLSDLEIQSMELYGLQEKFIREITKIMEYSTGTIHSIVKYLL